MIKTLDSFYSVISTQFKNSNKRSAEGNSILTSILQHLVESTNHLPSIWFKENEQGVFSGITSEWEEGYISKWHLVVLYCRLHSLEIYTNHLKELAAQNEWVQFLYEAQIQRLRSEQIFQLLPHFADVQLREHLTVVISNISSHSMIHKRKSSVQLGDELKEENIFDILLAVEKDPRGAINMLLLKCCYQKRPLLSVIASHYKNDIIEDCLLSWIFAQSFSHLSENLERNILSYIQQNYYAPDILESINNHGVFVQDQMESVDFNHFDLLFSAIVELCSSKQLISVIEGFGTFDPQNPLLLYFHFHRCFLQSKFLDADRYFTEFAYILQPDIISHISPVYLPKIKQIIGNIQLDQYKISIGDKNWIKQLVFKLLDNLQKKCPSDYELNRLLSLLSKLRFADHFVNQFTIFKLLQTTNIDATISTPPTDVVSILIEKGFFIFLVLLIY